jgi:hypothetical protein
MKTILGALVLAVIFLWYGQWLWFGGCLFGAYYALKLYNHIHGDGAPTYTFQECQDAWEDQESGN